MDAVHDVEKRSITVVFAVVLAGFLLLAGFVLAWSGGDAHNLDKQSYGLTRGETGDLTITISPCEPSGVGLVRVGLGSDDPFEDPDVVGTIRLESGRVAAYEVSLSSPQAGYTSTGTIDPTPGPRPLIWSLIDGGGNVLNPSAFTFEPSEIRTGAVYRGDGSTVPIDEWEACGD